MAQGCSISTLLYIVWIGIQLHSIGGFLFADDFVGISDSSEAHRLHKY